LRLAAGAWLVWTGVVVLSDPRAAAAAQGAPLATLLPMAALAFTLGIFLLTGFMSRVAGVLLTALAGWQAQALGLSPPALALGLLGLYLALRGGGAWAMDVYVEKMQDRVRQREAAKAGQGG
jgi:hypothetical protein